MKKLLILCALFAGFASAYAQKVIDNFTVGPYVVDYLGEGDVNYRLRDNIDLYEFFELKKDTVKICEVVAVKEVETPIKHAVEITALLGTNRNNAAGEAGFGGVWKQNVAKNLYFNAGLSFTFPYAKYTEKSKRNMFEVGIPLQIEWGKLNHQKGTLYGLFELTPAVYTTLSAKVWENNRYVDADKKYKKSGFLITPGLELGGNIPVGNVIMRIGVYGRYKLNCTKGDYDVYGNGAGCFFYGGRISVII